MLVPRHQLLNLRYSGSAPCAASSAAARSDSTPARTASRSRSDIGGRTGRHRIISIRSRSAATVVSISCDQLRPPTRRKRLSRARSGTAASPSGFDPDDEGPGERFAERVAGDQVDDGATRFPRPEEDGAGGSDGGEDQSVGADDAVGEDPEELDAAAGPDPPAGGGDADDVTDGEDELAGQPLVVRPQIDVPPHGGLP